MRSLVERLRARLHTLDPGAFRPWPPGGMLVGGAVRDALLGRERTDLDWLVPDAEAAAKWVADRLGGSAFALDEDRGYWRSVAPFGAVNDFVPLPADPADDLRRRDMTVNALALTETGELHDPTGGLADLRAGLLRMTSRETLAADPLRAWRAVRLAAELGFALEPRTSEAVREEAAGIASGASRPPARERVRDELTRTLLGPAPHHGVHLAHDHGLLTTALPELAACAGVAQGPLHHLDVLDHSIEALRLLVLAFPDAGLDLRLATLLHDVGKPAVVAKAASGRPIFHGHDRVGADMARAALARLRFEATVVSRAAELVRRHMLPLPGTERGARRFAHRYSHLLPDLVSLMVADREAARGRAAGPAGRMRYRRAMSRVLAAAAAEPPAATLLTGDEVMELLGLVEGPRVGEALRLVAEARAVGDVVDREGAERLLKSYAAAQGWGTVDTGREGETVGG